MIGNDLRAVQVALFSALGAFLFGLDIGYIASILECASFKRDVVHLANADDPHAEIPGAIVGFIVGVFSLGCVCASAPPVSACFLDGLGRRASISVGSAVFVVGCIAQASAHSVGHILFGRLVAGLSIGLLSTVVALYQSELAPPTMRGSLTSLYNLLITFGILAATILNLVLVEKEDGWRISILLQIVPAAALCIGMLFLPRSPRWLVQQGRLDEARSVLLQIRSDTNQAEEEYSEIVSNHRRAAEQGEPRWVEVLSGRGGRLAMVGVSLQLLQQLCGMNAFMYFGPRMYASMNWDANVLQTCSNTVNFFSTFAAILFVDKIGRKSLLLYGALGMFVTCMLMGSLGTAYFTKEQNGALTSQSPAASVTVVVIMFTFILSFACSWGPVVWVYCAEMFPLRLRSRLMGMATMANWVGNYVIAQFTPVFFDRIGFATFFIFAGFSLTCMALATWLPETRGVMLERVEGLFDQKFDPAVATVAEDCCEVEVAATSKSYGSTA